MTKSLFPWQAPFLAEYMTQHGEETLKQNEIRVACQPMANVNGLLRVRLDEQPTLHRPDQGSSTPLPLEAATEISLFLIEANFFSIPSNNDKVGLDGITYLIEANLGGHYHYVCHWQPDDPRIPQLYDELWAIAQPYLNA